MEMIRPKIQIHCVGPAVAEWNGNLYAFILLDVCCMKWCSLKLVLVSFDEVELSRSRTDDDLMLYFVMALYFSVRKDMILCFSNSLMVNVAFLVIWVLVLDSISRVSPTHWFYNESR